MADFVEYSRNLMESAKGFRTHAITLPEGEPKQAFLRASLLHACSFLEAHLNYLAEHFTTESTFSLHERGVLLEREIRFNRGVFQITDALKISRMTDRIDILLNKFTEDAATSKSSWYPNLTSTLKTRNALVHPKDSHILTEDDVELALLCVLDATDTLYNAVFKKGLPYVKKGIEGGSFLAIE